MSLLLLFPEGSTDRRAVVTWAELEVPNEPRRAVVTWAEFEVPAEPRRAVVTWAELEVPNEPRRAVVTWAELEVPDLSGDRRAILTWAELEIPNEPRRAVVTWVELEVPNEPRRAVVTWAEFETPSAPRRAVITWAELETPNAPTTDRRAVITWAEFEVPGGADSGARRRTRRIRVSVRLASPIVEITAHDEAPRRAQLRLQWPTPAAMVWGRSQIVYRAVFHIALDPSLVVQLVGRIEALTFDLSDEAFLLLADQLLNG